MAVTRALPIAGTATNTTTNLRKIANNMSTVTNNQQDETTRALRVLAQRQAAGQDTSLQEKYLRQNLGYSGEISKPSAAAQTNLTNIPLTQSKTPTLSQQLLQQMQQITQKDRQPFTFNYNRDADPNYQAALAQAQRNIATNNNAISADNNRRGILNSTITTDRQTQDANDTLARLETDVVPALLNNAYNQQLSTYQTNQQGDQQQLANLQALAGLYQQDEQNSFNNKVTESGITGYYMPDGAQPLINNILGLKQQAEAKGISAQDRAKLSAQADAYRAQLLSMGVDPSAYGSAVTANAAAAAPGVRTLQGQQLDQQKKQSNINNSLAYSELTGRVLTPQEDPSGYLRQAASGKAPLTLAAQGQAFNQAYQTNRAKVSDDQWNQTFGYQKERDAVADSQFQQQYEYNAYRAAIGDQQWQAQFDQNVKEYDLNYALNYAIQNGQLSLQQAQDARDQAEFNYKMQTGNAAPSITAEEYRDKFAKSIERRDDDGKLLNPQELESTILSSGLSDYEAYRLIQQYKGDGLTWKGAVPSPPQVSSTGYTGGATKQTTYDPYIESAAKTNGVSTSLVKGIIQAESSFNPNAGSSAGAQGLMQLMPATAKGLGVTNIKDPQQNINGGTKFIAGLISKYNGDVQLALAAYNAGPGRVDSRIKKYGNSWDKIKAYMPQETQAYVGKVLANEKSFRG
ncbi:lytic transglycosylase domain-containing protein [Paenibacillus kandeliae]|uniref:lytic transglycosylase domain-containing protein n=1 Tax=Paenibacillus kandeliae TaxID=3231269 RepID=UPI0034583078